MKLEGDYLFEASVAEVWSALFDPVILAAVMPGCEKLELVDGQYVGEIKVKVGPIQGKFTGKVDLKDKIEPESYTMVVDGRGAPGFVKATAAVKLAAEGDRTRVFYDTDAQIGGKIASVGQRLLEASARAIAAQSLEGLHANIKLRAAAYREAADKRSAADPASPAAAEDPEEPKGAEAAGTGAASAAGHGGEAAGAAAQATQATRKATEAASDHTEAPSKSPEAATRGTEAPINGVAASSKGAAATTNGAGTAGKLTDAAGNPDEVTGKAAEAAGKATEAVGKATEAVGKATEATGKATEAVGKAIEAASKAAEAASKSTEATGKVAEAVGKGAQAAGTPTAAEKAADVVAFTPVKIKQSALANAVAKEVASSLFPRSVLIGIILLQALVIVWLLLRH